MRTALLLLLAPALLAAQTPTPEQLYRERKHDELRKAMTENLARNKNDHRSMYWIGRAYEDEDKFGEAVDWFEKALKLNDTSALYHNWLGNALGGEAGKASKLRQPFLARRLKSEYERAVQLDPKMLDPRVGLIEFYTQAPGVMGGSMDKAREQAAEIGKIHPYEGHFAMARVAQRQKDFAAEGKAYEAAYAAAPESLRTNYSLGAYYRRQGKYDQAFAMHDSVRKHWPNEIAVLGAYGYTASMSGKNLERGERDLKAYFANPPKDVNNAGLSFYRYHLGQIYEKTGRKAPARAEYDEAIKLNKDNADAKKALDALK